jgi:Tfp pilus assembly protein PilF
MKIQRFSRLLTLLVLLPGVAGCQSGFNWKMPSFGSSNTPPQPGVAQAPKTAPLTQEQKTDMQIAMARSLELDGHQDSAAQLYESIIKKDPKSPTAYHRLALLYDKKGDGQKADSYYRQALERDPKNPELLCDMGYSYYVQRRWRESESRLNQALELNPNLERAHMNLGLVMAHSDRQELALAEFKKGGCKEADAHVNLAYCYLWDKRTEPAADEFQKALKVDPGSKSAEDGLVKLRQWAVEAATMKQTVDAGSPSARPQFGPLYGPQFAPAAAPPSSLNVAEVPGSGSMAATPHVWRSGDSTERAEAHSVPIERIPEQAWIGTEATPVSNIQSEPAQVVQADASSISTVDIVESHGDGAATDSGASR